MNKKEEVLANTWTWRFRILERRIYWTFTANQDILDFSTQNSGAMSLLIKTSTPNIEERFSSIFYDSKSRQDIRDLTAYSSGAKGLLKWSSTPNIEEGVPSTLYDSKPRQDILNLSS